MGAGVITGLLSDVFTSGYITEEARVIPAQGVAASYCATVFAEPLVKF